MFIGSLVGWLNVGLRMIGCVRRFGYLLRAHLSVDGMTYAQDRLQEGCEILVWYDRVWRLCRIGRVTVIGIDVAARLSVCRWSFDGACIGYCAAHEIDCR